MTIARSDPDAPKSTGSVRDDLSIGPDDEAIRTRDEALLSELDELDGVEDANPVPATGVTHEMRAAVEAKRAEIAADNKAAKEARDARRRAARRASKEYQAELKEARDTYEAKILAEEGREVRAYIKVPGKTRGEREEGAKARDAARKRDERSRATQVEKDAAADKKWAARQRKKNVPEEQIAQGLAKRAADRQHRQPEPGPYEDNPNFGAF